jgi:radical SAM protein with 4Fe4S-binding SPASM domain
MLLQPCELLELFPLLNELAERAERDGILFYTGNNIGYYGPYERRLRKMQAATPDAEAMWDGCQAGISSIGIEADGAVKGCPSLPTAAYVGGNIRERTLREILEARELNINAGMGTPEGAAHLWGFCGGCAYAELCRGGCTWTAHVFFGRAGNNPYCHHRALLNERRGMRERLVQVEAAGGAPFDHGRFAVVEEGVEAAWPEGARSRFTAESVLRLRPAAASAFSILG